MNTNVNDDQHENHDVNDSDSNSGKDNYEAVHLTSDCDAEVRFAGACCCSLPTRIF